jgi:pimeloyl-ACP methyl ester carboxylesterase
MNSIVLFPGLGASEKLFERYDFGNTKTLVIKFLVPEKNETLQHYSLRLAETIPVDENMVFIGVSFGGILAQEVSKIIPAKKIILISTIKTENEKPGYFSLVKTFPAHKVLPVSWLKTLVVLLGDFFTPKSNEERKLFLSFVREADSRMIRWGIHQTIHWEQKQMPGNIIHIHGSKDRLFPLKKIKNYLAIEDGSHFMVIQRSEEINALINTLIADLP